MTLFDQIKAAPKSSAIYQIVCSANGRRYVGSAVSLRKRWGEHYRQLSESRHHSSHMQRAWNKHGPQAFDFAVIEHCSREELIGREQFYIDSMAPEFNTSPTAGSQLGYRHTPETRQKMSESRPKDFSPMTGKQHTEETKRQISQSRRGKGGTGWTQERRDRIGAAHKGRVKSPEHRAKIAATLTGHKQSAEQIEKRMQKIRGRKMPEGFAAAASARMMGQRLSEQAKNKIALNRAKLTEDQVRYARGQLAVGVRQRVIAAELSVDQSVISEMKSGKTYRWVA